MCRTWMLCALLLLVGWAGLVKMADIDSTNSTLSDDDAAEETQHTYCKIATEELQATANATITRQLKGVCTSRELKRAMAAIMKEIHTLKDALIGQAGYAHAHNAAKRNKRKDLLELFAISNNRSATEENHIPMNKGEIKGRYSYYWTIADVEQHLQDGVSLKSPLITFQETKYFLRLTISKRVVTIRLFPEEQTQTHKNNTYSIFVLNLNQNGRDLRLDASNAYSATFRRLRAFQRAADITDTLFIKLVIV